MRPRRKVIKNRNTYQAQAGRQAIKRWGEQLKHAHGEHEYIQCCNAD